MKISLLFVSLFLAVVMQGCQQSDGHVESADKKEEAEMVNALRMDFMEREEGIDPYRVRMLVTADYLRMDEGRDSDDFLLFDRRKKIIYSVTHADQSILRIPHRGDLLAQESTLDFGLREHSNADMPDFNGKKPRHLAFTANAKTCYEVVAVEDFLPEAVQAMREYLLTLSGEQIVNLNKTPVEMRSDCMLANLIYKPVRHLEHGFPLREWDYKGYVRELLDYGREQVSAELFRLNPSYRVTQLGAAGLELVPDDD